MTPEEERNISVVRRNWELEQQGDLDAALRECWAPDGHNHSRPGGHEAIRKVRQDIRRTFPDWRIDVVDTIASGSEVVALVRVSGTHLGTGELPVNGGLLVGVPPTGKRFEVQHIHWYTLAGGKIVNHRACRDDLGMMRQLGLLPDRL